MLGRKNYVRKYIFYIRVYTYNKKYVGVYIHTHIHLIKLDSQYPPTVVNTRQPMLRAMAMAAWPTPPEPE